MAPYITATDRLATAVLIGLCEVSVTISGTGGWLKIPTQSKDAANHRTH